MKRDEIERLMSRVEIDPEMINLMIVMSAYKSSSRPIVSRGMVEYDKTYGEIVPYDEFLDRFMESLAPPVKDWPTVKQSVRVMIVVRTEGDANWKTLFDCHTTNAHY